MRCEWVVFACAFVIQATFIVSHPALLRNIICQSYLLRRVRLVEVWYSALLNELNRVSFGEQTPDWQSQAEATRKLQSAKQRCLASMNDRRSVEDARTNIRSSFENYKRECSEILAIIRNLSAVQNRQLRIVPTVQVKLKPPKGKSPVKTMRFQHRIMHLEEGGGGTSKISTSAFVFKPQNV
nr:PREDICTED: uncharacterized protein LOC109031875 [Bemisia tabaci]